ncbi:MAG: hypothetical protein Kow00109_11240 [Acidobacteriota bacterium]
MAVGAVILVIVGVLGWRSYSAGQEAERQAAFAEALRLYHAEVRDPDAAETPETSSEPVFSSREEKYTQALEKFEELAANYSGTTVGRFADYYAALCLRELGRLDEAQARLEDLLSRVSSPDLKNLVQQSLAEMAAAAGDHKKAAEIWQEIVDAPAARFPMSIALLRLAEAKERAGDLAEALELYRRIVREFPGSTAASQATTLIRRLEPRVAAQTPPGAPGETTAPGPDAPAEEN